MMANYLTNKSSLENIAAIIKEKVGNTSNYLFPNDFITNISDIKNSHFTVETAGYVQGNSPSYYENSTLTKLRFGVFWNCSNLTSVSFPSCINIDGHAFRGCIKLLSASFPKCKTISYYGFCDCYSLSSIYMPSLSGSLYAYAFANCYNLKEFPVCNVSTLGSFVFRNCYELSSISLSMCSIIGEGAFYGCSNLKDVSFIKCISIAQYAFYNCINLSYAYFSSSASIGPYAFYNCSNMESINLSNNCKYIGPYAFYNCKKLSISSSYTIYSCSFVGEYAFANCEELPIIAFNGFSSRINSHTFENCYNLSRASLNSCIYISDYAFNNCSNLETVTASSCKTIGAYAFCNCSSVFILSFPSCTQINTGAFQSCYKLKDLWLRGSQYVALANSTAFSSTPIAGYTEFTSGTYGRILVPRSMYSTYIRRANWAYYSSRMVSV